MKYYGKMKNEKLKMKTMAPMATLMLLLIIQVCYVLLKKNMAGLTV